MNWDGFEQFVVGTALAGIFLGLFLLIARSIFKGVSAAKKEQIVDEQKAGKWFLAAIIVGGVCGRNTRDRVGESFFYRQGCIRHHR